MDTASIRIQFNSLVKTINGNKSKCHLEIIPNVTNVENIDKIEWKSGKNKTEYVLPINYKIVFKKAVVPADSEDDKVYYSCVDLLHSPVKSVHNVELGSGDVSRIVSDTTFIQKLTHMQGNLAEKLKTALTNDYTQSFKYHCMEKKEGYSKQVATVKLDIFKDKNLQESSFIYFSDDILCAAKKTVSVQIEISKEEFRNYKGNEVLNEQIHSFEANIMKSESVKTLTDLNAKLEIDSKLTMTSIISERDTQHPLLKTVYQNTSFCNTHMFFPSYESTVNENNKDKQNTTTCCAGNEITRRNCTDNITDPVMTRFSSEFKVVTALRLSNFIQKIENEMLPLRIALNEITNKCIQLGLSLESKSFENPVSREIYPQAYTIESCYKRHKVPSNRGVYAIVSNK